MSSKSILLVTFPVDLGNRTLESNLQALLAEDVDLFRFAEKHADDSNSGKITLSQSIRYRFKSALALRKIVKKYSEEGKSILFHGLSPALFAYGAWNPKRTAIALDWTRNLYPSALGEPIKKNWVFKLHSKVLQHCPKIMCFTAAVRDNLEGIYGIQAQSLYQVPMPFLVDKLNIPPRPTPKKPRVLFVGGDLQRKGGDILVKGWQNSLKDKCSLTMMTNDLSADVEGVQYLPGIKYGSESHKKAFEEHDILVLPTRIDGYPQVIGEAAAAGLAVITTKYALGAKEVITDGVSGYISDSPEECITKLNTLLEKPSLIDEFKQMGYKLMHRKFSKKVIRERYLEILKNVN